MASLDNEALRSRISDLEAGISKAIAENSLDVLGSLMEEDRPAITSCTTLYQIDAAEHTKLQVKVELETERRMRIQTALDDAEKRCFAANKSLEKKSGELERFGEGLERMRESYETKLRLAQRESSWLQQLLREKEKKVLESQTHAKELTTKAEEFEELFIGQLDTVKALQEELAVASQENRALVKEMEMLNEMFAEMERTHVDEALSEYTCKDPDLSDAAHKDKEGKVVAVQDILKAVEQESRSSVQDSCFKEVTTKNGTRMVLSVSKTFMKLKDLILEKKTLEDQVEKMKTINQHLCAKVDTHEAKLWNITDELNKTWNYVSTLKLQHRKLHTNEQILRAELNEKRQLLARLRDELEYSRQNWELVKKKTADSEREWRALREEFAARRKEFSAGSSSESGFSDCGQTDTEEAHPQEQQQQQQQQHPLPEEQVQNEETAASKDDEEKLEEGNDVEEVEEAEPSLVFVPPLDFMAQVPDELMPPILPKSAAAAVTPDDDDDSANCSDIYDRLLASTQRSAVLVSRLAEVNRTLMDGEGANAAVGTSTGNNSLESSTEEDEEDVEPQTDASEKTDELTVESPDIVSDIMPLSSDMLQDIEEEDEEEEREEDETPSSPEQEDIGDPDKEDEESTTSELSLADPFPDGLDLSRLPESISECSENNELDNSTPVDPALWDQVGDEELEEDEPRHIPTPPPPPNFSLLPPTASVSVRPTFAGRIDDLRLIGNVDSNSDDDDDDEEVEGAGRDDSGAENATAVTRFLIKHLPKQMSKLRDDKAELEEKIRDLEGRISQRDQDMREMERRLEVKRNEAEANKANCDEAKVRKLFLFRTFCPFSDRDFCDSCRKPCPTFTHRHCSCPQWQFPTPT